jgi:glycosyltransferase involved in cell wall biosynthesis
MIAETMRVLMVSKACVVGIYQRKIEEIARYADVELVLVVPPSWRDPAGEIPLEYAHTQGYQLCVAPIVFNGNFHLHYFPTLPRLIASFRPDIVHIDEEPYNVAAWQAQTLARQRGARTLFFSWQNILRRYPPPFAWGEAWMLRDVNYAIMGTNSAADVWRAKGYAGPLAVIPQFGVDPERFRPCPRPDRPFTIGFAGRLVPEKGADLLIQALSGLDGAWQLRIAGNGPEREAIEGLAKSFGLADRVSFLGSIPSTQMDSFYHSVDCVVIASRTRTNWKEQFGRVIVEAMACGVPVIGSDSAAIPDVMGDAGVIFPEGDAAALQDALRRLRDSRTFAESLATKGRERVLAHYTHAQVAAATVDVYRVMLTHPATR